MKVIVAGARGFIGSRARAALVAAGHEVIPFDREQIEALHAGRTASPTADTLVWSAGKREADPERSLDIHARIPVRLATGVHHVVYLSTGEVYGTAPLPYREGGPTLGTSDYARAKLAGEAALSSAVATTVLRLALVYGTGSKPPMLIPRLVAALRAGERFPMTHGEQTRDLVFVDDVARAIVRAVEAPATTSHVFNIASGAEVRIREVCEGIARAIAAEQDRRVEDLLALLGFGEVGLRPDEAHRYVMDVSRARDELGWSVTTSLAEGIALL